MEEYPEKIPPIQEHTIGTALVAVYRRRPVAAPLLASLACMALALFASVQAPTDAQARAHPVVFAFWAVVVLISGGAGIALALAIGGPMTSPTPPGGVTPTRDQS